MEHRWDGGWRLFDAHDDARTALADEQVGRIAAEDLRAFPNRAAENPWLGSYRIPGLGRFAALRTVRPPALLTTLAETPSLVAVAVGVTLLALGLALVPWG